LSNDHWFEILKDILIAFPTVTFTGWIAYWTWRRDQERLRVQKYLVFDRTIEGKPVLVTNSEIGVLVINLSLFPVRICAVGFTTPEKGKPIELRDAEVEVEKQEQFAPPPFPNLQRGKVRWPVEIPSHSRQLFYSGRDDLIALAKELPDGFRNTAACKAIAVTETRKRIYSRPSWHWRLANAWWRMRSSATSRFSETLRRFGRATHL